MADILIVAEHADDKLKKYSTELAGKAAELAGACGGLLTAVLFGEKREAAAMELGRFGVKKVFLPEHADLASCSGENCSKVLCDLVAKEKPAFVFATASTFGRDLMARSAMRLRTGRASDCVAVSVDGGRAKLSRPVFGGKAIAEVAIDGSPQMATLRPNLFPVPAPASNEPELVPFAAEPGPVRARVVGTSDAESGMVDLAEAERIVSGGRAVGSAENFAMIKELAAALRASVGASRAAVDAGFISHDHQVGQTGKTVNPTLYVACGISGAIQHLAGMRTSKVVVAINRDPEAPIFSKADYGIVGDIFKVVPALTRAARRLLSE